MQYKVISHFTLCQNWTTNQFIYSKLVKLSFLDMSFNLSDIFTFFYMSIFLIFSVTSIFINLVITKKEEKIQLERNEKKSATIWVNRSLVKLECNTKMERIENVSL